MDHGSPRRASSGLRHGSPEPRERVQMRRVHFAMLSMIVAFPSFVLAHAEGSSQPARTGEEALRQLKAGNARFVAGKAVRKRLTLQRVKETAQSQKPEAIILGCADSRVPPEVVF